MKTYGTLEFTGGRWVMSNAPPHVAIRLKQLFPRIPKARVEQYGFDNNPDVCADLEWFLHRYPMKMKDGDRERLVAGQGLYEQERAEIERIFLPEWQPPPRYGFRPGFELWGIQHQAVEMLHRKRQLLLGDTVGNGKTFSALGAVVGSRHLPTAAVMNAHLARQWVTEFIQPFTYLTSHIIEGTSVYNLPPANIYLFKYSNIHAWADIAATGMFRSFVADEVHELRRGVGTQKGAACKVFADRAYGQGGLSLGMSGTLVFNYGDEVFNIAEIMAPGVLGSREEFYREWCTTVGNHWIVDDPDALGTYLRDVGVFLRREREGRPLNIQVIPVEFDYDEQRKNQDLAQKLAIKTISGSFVEAGNAARQLDLMMRHDTGVGKARGVAAFARMLLSQKIPVLLFGWHREVYEIWLRELADFNPVMFTGSETVARKDKSKRSFINGDTNLALISLRSGQGIDGLQKRCSTVIFGEYDWSKSQHEQCIGRVDRPGQPEEVIDVFYCHADEGSDPTIINVHAIKASQARGINSPNQGPKPIYHDERRIRTLAQNYLRQQGVS